MWNFADIRLYHAPDAWVYKHFYNVFSQRWRGKPFKISIPFDGRTIKVKSLQTNDSNPSLVFYYKDGQYRWKDFSTEGSGDSVDFVGWHLNEFYSPAKAIIDEAYKKFIASGTDQWEWDVVDNENIKPSVEITADNKRMDADATEFWNRFKISGELLDEYNVRQLSTLFIKSSKPEPRLYSKNDPIMFGFYSKDKGLYQVYQPNSEKAKYMTVRNDYLIGTEQLEYGCRHCVIVSGLKDLMALKACQRAGPDKLKFDIVAPMSESVIISKDKMDWLKSKYTYVLTMLDNDLTGRRFMNHYRRVYGIPYVHVQIEKDLAQNNAKQSLNHLNQFYGKIISYTVSQWEMSQLEPNY